MRISVFSLSLLFAAAAVAATTDSHSHDPQPLPLSARSLDALLQAGAFEALSRRRVRTGVAVPARVQDSLAGIAAEAVRLRSGSLRLRGVESYGEFRIPAGVTEQPYAKRVALVYQNLGNLSSRFYPLPGFDYLAPVLGLIAYDASNLTAAAADSPELDLVPSSEPIAARFGSLPGSALCVFFDLHGSVQFDRPARGEWCEMARQGHVAVAVESATPSPAPAGLRRPEGRRGAAAGKIAAACLAGAAVVAAGIAVVVWVRVRGGRRNAAAARDKRAGDNSLEVTSFGGIRAPFARVTRTRPVLEDRYVP